MTVMNLEQLEVWKRARDNVRFWYMAHGSLTEVQSHLSLANSFGYVSDEVYKQMTSDAESITKQLNNYLAYLKRSKQVKRIFQAGIQFARSLQFTPPMNLQIPTINQDPLTISH